MTNPTHCYVCNTALVRASVPFSHCPSCWPEAADVNGVVVPVEDAKEKPKCGACGLMLARNAGTGDFACWTDGCVKFAVLLGPDGKSVNATLAAATLNNAAGLTEIQDANQVAKKRQAADRALAATEAERLARALRGEVVPKQMVSCAPNIASRMPPPFAVCEGHEKRLEALEERLAVLEAINDAEDAELNVIADERAGQPVATLCPNLEFVQIADEHGTVFFGRNVRDAELVWSDDGRTLRIRTKR